VVEVGLAFDLGVQAPQVLEAGFVEVAHEFELAIRQGPEVANQIGTPVSAADNSYFYWIFHFFLPKIAPPLDWRRRQFNRLKIID
jgi:hypothetical protein